MSKQADPKLIGAFVLGAIVLVVAGVVIFGRGDFFKQKLTYVMYFKGSVSGLDIGAPVTFRGVRVGSVSDISLQVDPKGKTIRIPVVVAIEPGRVKGRLSEEIESAKESVEIMVERGMRAQLAIQSLVTGKLYIDLAIHPHAKADSINYDGAYPEMPTIASQFDQIADTIKKIPLDQLADKALSAVDGIDRIVNSPEVMGTIRSIDKAAEQFPPLALSMHETLNGTRDLLRSVNGQIEPLTANYQSIAKDTKKLLASADALLISMQATSASAQAAMDEASKALLMAERLFDDDSPVLFEVKNTLKALASAARSVGNMADYIERHPDALLYGKAEAKGR